MRKTTGPMLAANSILVLLVCNLVTGQEIGVRTGPKSEASGLLATVLNQHPTGEGPLERSFCCCASGNCPPTSRAPDYDDDINEADLVGSGLINPRVKDQEEEGTNPRSGVPDIAIRIVNNPPPPKSAPIIGAQCPQNQKTCCYSSKEYVASLGNRCSPAPGSLETAWRQGCRENVRPAPGGKRCGQRSFTPVAGSKPGEAYPDEFPWTCLILTGNNDFVGGCAIVPDSIQNDISQGTRRVITVAHKLAKLKKNDLLKVRILEYDASGFSTKETVKHQEYTVVRFVKHPQYNPKRLSDDIAVLILEKPIDLVQYNGINAACLPSCRNMFDYRFSNGTGTRCWVAGWGKDDFDGNYQFLQHKVDVPIYDRLRCESRLQAELSKINSDLAKSFVLHPGEMCAGGEKGKDACEGDGGAPLVCQSDTGLFHVVGLVAWGVDCANEDVPGVYVNIYNYIDFITQRV